MANADGGVFGYAGMYADFGFGRYVLTPLVGAGAYHRGGNGDLGGAFEFRLSLALAYEFRNHNRLGVQFAHISNAGTHHINPGENEALLVFAIPVRWFGRR